MDVVTTVPVFYSRGRQRYDQLGGLPSPPGASEPSGDAGEGRDLPVNLRRTDDDSYRPHPNMPSANQLDYVQKASISTLLFFGLILLVGLMMLSPRRALGLVSRGAQHHAGMR